MKTMTIFAWVMNSKQQLEKQTLRKITVTESFEGINSRGEVIRDKFKALADSLEPHNGGFEVI